MLSSRSPFCVVVATMLCSIAGVSSSAECFQIPRQIAAPQDGLVYRSHLGAALVGKPATVDFYSPERYIVSIARPSLVPGQSSKINPPFDLRILLRDRDSGAFEEYCRADRRELNSIFRDARFFVHSEAARAKEWRVELTDHATALPPGQEHADPLTMEISKFPIRSYEETDAYGRGASRAISLDCLPRPNVPTARDEPRQQTAEVGLDFGSAVFIAASNGPMTIEFDTRHPSAAPVSLPASGPPLPSWPAPEVRISVKQPGSGPFQAHCTLRLMSVAQLPRETMTVATSRQGAALTEPLIWRVEVVAPRNSDRLTRVALRYKPEAMQAGSLPSEFQCAAPPNTRATMTPSNERAFAGATMLSVRITDPDQMLSTAERKAVADHLLTGMALWRPVCYLCTPDQLVLADVDGSRYALASLVEALDAFYTGQLREPPFPASAALGGKYAQVLSLINARAQGRGLPSSVPYVQVPRPTAGFEGLCKDQFENLPAALKRVRLAWECKGEPSRPDMSNLKASAQLAFRLTPLEGCPAGANTVACESSALKIELNAKDYRFVSRPGNQRLGRGKRDVDLQHVLTHEIGHWIGIGHLDEPGSIMNEAMSQSRCIDTAATHAINILAAGGRYPVKTPQAFLYEPSTSQASPPRLVGRSR